MKGLVGLNICGLQKLSLLDFPGLTAATVFTGGCNFRCPFCHNALLVTEGPVEPIMTEDEFFTFLNNRKGLLDGVCVSGGEPLICPDIAEFIGKIRKLGFKVKLDTNGSFSKKLKELLDAGLIDYVAMDIKNCAAKYGETVGIDNFDVSPILDSIEIIKNSGVDYEFRTTTVKELHTANDIAAIGRMIKGAKRYFLQTFVDSGNLIDGKGLHAVPKEEMNGFVEVLTEYVKNTQIRGQ